MPFTGRFDPPTDGRLPFPVEDGTVFSLFPEQVSTVAVVADAGYGKSTFADLAVVSGAVRGHPVWVFHPEPTHGPEWRWAADTEGVTAVPLPTDEVAARTLIDQAVAVAPAGALLVFDVDDILPNGALLEPVLRLSRSRGHLVWVSKYPRNAHALVPLFGQMVFLSTGRNLAWEHRPEPPVHEGLHEKLDGLHRHEGACVDMRTGELRTIPRVARSGGPDALIRSARSTGLESLRVGEVVDVDCPGVLAGQWQVEWVSSVAELAMCGPPPGYANVGTDVWYAVLTRDGLRAVLSVPDMMIGGGQRVHEVGVNPSALLDDFLPMVQLDSQWSVPGTSRMDTGVAVPCTIRVGEQKTHRT